MKTVTKDIRTQRASVTKIRTQSTETVSGRVPAHLGRGKGKHSGGGRHLLKHEISQQEGAY